MPVSVQSCDLHLFCFRVPSPQKVNVKFDCISIVWWFLLRPIFDVLYEQSIFGISCFETSDSKILQVKYSSQSDFDLAQSSCFLGADQKERSPWGRDKSGM